MTTMKNSIHDNANGLDYTFVNDHYLPNLTVAAPTVPACVSILFLSLSGISSCCFSSRIFP